MNKKERVITAAIAVLSAIAASLIVVHMSGDPAPLGFQSGGGMSMGGGGGLSKVTATDPLTGSGTSGNPLALSLTKSGLVSGTGSSGSPLNVSISTTGIVSGTGSSGSPLTATEVGDISGVTAGSGLSGGGSTGAVTLAVGAGSGILASGSTTAANLGAGLTFSSGAIVPNLTGATCTDGQAVTAISSAGTGTCGNAVSNAYTGTHLEWNSEFFVGGTPAANTPLEGIWLHGPTTNNAGIGQTTLGTTTRPGLAALNGGNAATSTGRIQTNTSAFDLASYTSATIECTLGVSALSDTTDEYSVLIGFADTTGSMNQADGCYFLYDRVNGATSGPNSGNASKWEAWCTSNSTRTTVLLDGSTQGGITTVDAPVAAYSAPSTNIYTLNVTVTGTSSAVFKVNGSTVTTLTTNLPASGRLTGAMVQILRSAGTSNNRYVALDRCKLAIDLASARSP